ncbi:MAG: two-component regulator propeller domain-containing protein [Chitinophagales bacterium]
MRYRFSIILLLLFILFGFSTKKTIGQQYIFHNYSVEDGVAQSQVYDILQDSRGFLWIGTRGGGISRFDGSNFKTYTNKDGLCNNYIWSLQEDSEHNIWIATNNGISKYNGIRFQNFYPESNQSISVQDLYIVNPKEILLATQKGIYLLKDNHFINLNELSKIKKESYYTICKVGETYWCGNSNGISIISKTNNNYTIETAANKLGVKSMPVNTIKKDDKNTVWIGTYGDGVYQYKNNKLTKFITNTLLDNQIVLDIYFDNNQNIWFGTLANGACIYNILSNSYSWITEKEGLNNNHIRSIIQDKSGNYWLGTSGGGIANYYGKEFVHFNSESGLGGNYIYSIYKDSRKRLWIGTSDKGLTVLDSGQFKIKDINNGFANVKVKSIIEDNYGNVYFGTDGNGVYISYGIFFTELEQFKGIYARAFDKDASGNIWLATAGAGLFKVTPSGNDGKNNISQHYTTANGLLNDRLTCLHIDKKGLIWYGTEFSGLGIFNPEKNEFKTFTKQDGLPSNSIRCLTEDKSGNLWIGTAGDGICCYTIYANPIKKYDIDFNSKLKSNNIYLLCNDAANNIFVGSETGLDYLELDKNKTVLKVKHYGKGEGFSGIETCQNAVFTESDGTIWFGTINGLSKYNPNSKIKNKNEPVTTITNVRLFYNTLDTQVFKQYIGDWNTIKNLQLPYNKNHLTFDFIGINLSNPDAVLYQWKLDGFDEKWSPPTTQHAVTYSNIPPGNYTFLVKSCNEDGIWNKIPTKIHFEITAPFWQKWWFIIAVILSVIALIYYIVRRRISNIKQKAKDQQTQLQLEKELSELEHKALRLQMNPHFLFNALNSIQSLIGTDKEQEARYYLAKFSSLMRQILDNSRNSTIVLQEEINMLENYLMIEKFCNGNRFDYTIDVDKNIETDYIKIPPMILQPFVENCIKHGLRYLQDKTGMINISFKELNNEIECTVTDNGIGRKQAEILNKQGKENYHKSAALQVTTERLALLNENKDTKNIEIIDLYDDQQQAVGTTVIIRIPIT